MLYTISERAVKDLTKVSPEVRQRIISKLDYLGENDLFVSNSRLMAGNFGGLFRIRIGDYRAIFEFVDNKATITRIGHRKDIYD